MSVLSVTTISSNATTDDFTIKTSNTDGPQIVLYANGYGVLLKSNSTSNNVLVNNSINYLNVNTSLGNFTSNGQILLTGVVTPTVISSNTSSWNPGTSNVSVIRLQANSSVTSEILLSGLTAGTNGQVLILSNIGTKRIVVRNEDSANESTAANRFNLTNHTILDGYQSMKIIYDGTLARWRRLSSIADASQYGITGFGSGPLLSGFDHKVALTKGFFSGGINNSSPAVTVTTADITTYSSESTAAVSGANLPVARAYLSAAGNADKGFFSGGNGVATPGSSLVATAYRTIYSAETTAAVSGANLTQARQGFAAAGNTDKGFFSSVAAPATAAMDRTTYSTETTAAVATAALTTNRTFLAAAGNPDKGFFSSSTPVAADRTTYASETTAAVSGANLTQNRSYLSAAGNADKGFFAGGFVSPASQVTTDRTTYSTETTAAVTGANLSQARDSSGASGDDEKSFFSGGTTNIGGSPAQITADRITYSTETRTAVTGANLSQARYGLAAV